jgi:protein-disulfide isomerase
LSNAGIAIKGDFLAAAYTSPVTLGILVGYVAGKPIGIVGASWLLSVLSRGRLRPPVGWGAVTLAGTTAGIGFTVSLLVATLAFRGVQLEQAKLGVLSAALCASVVSWVLFRATVRLPRPLRMRAMLSAGEGVIDLAAPVDESRDHLRGPVDAPVTIVEYADFECPYCGQAEPVVRQLLADAGDVRYVWRHFPLRDVHPHAQLAAEAAEAAAEQGAFWPMHDLLLDHQNELRPADLARYAEQLSLDTERFRDRLGQQAEAARIAEDVDSGDLSGVSGTPTLFINGRRLRGAYDITALTAAVRTARARAALTS